MTFIRFTDNEPRKLTILTPPQKKSVYWDNDRRCTVEVPPGASLPANAKDVWQCTVAEGDDAHTDDVYTWDMPEAVHKTLRLARGDDLLGLAFTVVRHNVRGFRRYEVTSIAARAQVHTVKLNAVNDPSVPPVEHTVTTPVPVSLQDSIQAIHDLVVYVISLLEGE